MPSGVLPDPGAFKFSLAEVPYGFIKETRTFWGALALPESGSASITVCLDDQGQPISGTVLLTGAVPSKGIPDKSLLIEGRIVDLVVVESAPNFWISWLFALTRSHKKLGYVSPLGVWDAYFPARPFTSVDQIFRKDWGPAGAPLNSYVGQVKCLF